MTSTSGVLAVLGDASLRDELDRVAAAVGVRLVRAGITQPPSRRGWSAAAAVVVDEAGARCCAESGLPRRARVFVVGFTEPGQRTWQAAISIGAQNVLTLPQQEHELVAELSDAGDPAPRADECAAAVAVIGGRGGAGASTFAAALALTAPNSLLVDVDPWSGGIDLLTGTEDEPGLRWPDLSLAGGRVNFTAIRDALPRRNGLSVLSGTRREGEIDAAALSAVIDAGRRGGATVICDLPRRLTPAVETALGEADLVVLVGTCDVRSCVATAAVAPVLAAINPNVGLVVRGPSPGGLRAGEVARVAEVPLLAAMRAQPRLPEIVERNGLRLNRRSPLAAAARRVLTVLQRHHVSEAA